MSAYDPKRDIARSIPPRQNLIYALDIGDRGPPDGRENAKANSGPLTPTPTKCGTACTATAPPDPCGPGSDGTVPITAIQTLGANSPCNGKTVTVRGIVTASTTSSAPPTTRSTRPTPASGSRTRRGTRGRPRRAACSSPASPAPAANPTQYRLGHHDHRQDRDAVRPGQLVPTGVGNQQPARTGIRPRRAPRRSTRPQPAAGGGRVGQDRGREPGPGHPPVLPRLQGMRVTLPVGIATGGGTTKFRDVFVEPGTTPRACSARTTRRRSTRRGRTRPPSSASRPTAAPQPGRPAPRWFSDTQVNLDLFDVVRNVTGPLTYSFSYYKIMPQLGGPAPTIERGPINAAYPPARPTRAEHAASRVLQRRELLPGGQGERRPHDHRRRVQGPHGRDRQRDPQVASSSRT